MTNPILLVCSVELEMRPLLARLGNPRPLTAGRVPAWTGTIGGRPVTALTAGIGKTNAGHALTTVLERIQAGGVLGFGVAGAYSGRGPGIAEVAIADVEHYGDEGAVTPTGWISCEALGIPLLDSERGRYFNEFPIDPELVSSARSVLGRHGISAHVGPFVTVSCCSGTTDRGNELARRFGAMCETMEGAAYAHIATLYGLPFQEVRGISNVVEDRDVSRWRLAEAAEAAARAASLIVTAWPSLDPVASADLEGKSR